MYLDTSAGAGLATAVYLGSGTDTVHLGSAGGVVHGGAGAAVITGTTGAMTIYSGAGAETVTGSSAADTFVFGPGPGVGGSPTTGNGLITGTPHDDWLRAGVGMTPCTASGARTTWTAARASTSLSMTASSVNTR